MGCGGSSSSIPIKTENLPSTLIVKYYNDSENELTINFFGKKVEEMPEEFPGFSLLSEENSYMKIDGIPSKFLTEMLFKSKESHEIEIVLKNGFFPNNMDHMFDDCSSIISINGSNWNASDIKSMKSTFRHCINLTSINFSNWNANNIESMNSTFAFCTNLKSINLNNWNFVKVKDLSFMFFNCENLTEVDTSNWNLTQAEKLSFMFSGCKSLKSLNSSKWDLRNALIMEEFFSECEVLNNIDVSYWNLTNIVNMNEMFKNCKSLTNLDLSKWINLKEDLLCINMFAGCINLKDIGEDTVKIFEKVDNRNKKGIFYDCNLLTNINEIKSKFGEEAFNLVKEEE